MGDRILEVVGPTGEGAPGAPGTTVQPEQAEEPHAASMLAALQDQLDVGSSETVLGPVIVTGSFLLDGKQEVEVGVACVFEKAHRLSVRAEAEDVESILQRLVV